MNRKNILLAAMVIICSSNLVFPISVLTAEQEQMRLQALWNLHANGALTIAQFVETGDSIGAVIDRDIALFQKDSEQALEQKKASEGFIATINPNILKMISIGMGALSVSGFVFVGIGFYAAYTAWNSGNRLESTYFDLLRSLYGNDHAVQCKIKYLTEASPDKDYNRVALASGMAAPFVAIASILSAGLAKYASNKSADWKKWNAEVTQMKQDQFNRNQVIIAQLKQIKYDNGL